MESLKLLMFYTEIKIAYSPIVHAPCAEIGWPMAGQLYHNVIGES